MSLFDEAALRKLIYEAARQALRDEQAERGQNLDEGYLDVATAADLLAVTSPTIRDWIAQGKLTEHWAGRERRISKRELHELAKRPPTTEIDDSPEQLARRYLAEKQKKHRQG